MTDNPVAPSSEPALSQQPYGTACRVFGQLLLGVAFLTIAGVIFTVFTYVPFIQRSIEEKGLHISNLTVTTFHFSEFCHEHWYLAVGGFLVFFTAATLLLWSRVVTGKVALAAAAICFMVSAFFGISFTLGVIAAVQELSGM